MNFSMVFSAVDRASKTMGKIMAADKKLARAMKGNAAKSQTAASKTSRSMQRVSKSMQGIKRAAQTAFNATVAGARAAGRAVKALHRQTIALGKRGFGNIKAGAKKAFRGAALGVGILTAAYGGAALAAGKLVGTASEFEKFQTMLVTSEGNIAGAQKAMSWINTFATKTPYQLQEVTKAFIALRSAGLDPTKGLMTSTGDAAAAMGIPIMQAVEAVKDAVVGENERLKELGITAAVKGNDITYTYMMNGQKKIATALKSDPAGIQKALEGIFDARFGGSMGRLANTWDGMLSTLAGAWDTFKVSIMNAGLFDWMKDKLTMVLDTVTKMQANGDLEKWAKRIGTAIQTALESAWEAGKRLYAILGNLGDILSKAATYVGGWENLAMILGGMAFAPMLVATAAGIVQITTGVAMLGAAMMANPISIAIAGIAAGAYLIYRNWDGISQWFAGVWNSIKSGASTVWEWMKTAFSWTPLGMIVANWDGISTAIADPINAAKGLASTAWEGIKSLFTGWVPDLGKWSLPTLEAGSLSKSWDTVKGMFTGWVPDFGKWSLPALDTGPLTRTWKVIKDLFDWSPMEALDRAFGGIAGKIGGYISEAADIAGTAWTRLKGVFSDESEVAIAVRDPASIERATRAAASLQTALKSASAIDMSGTSNEISRLGKAAAGLKTAVANGVNAAQSYLAGQSFHHHGVRLMDTMAAGMASRTAVVVNQIKAAMQQVRNHLPSSPAKVGPLSDIHRLKFGETIAQSINATPMIKAMRVAAAATMAAATPMAHNMAVAATATPVLQQTAVESISPVAARSTLPAPSQARSVSLPAPASTAKSNGAGIGARTVQVSYNPRIEINGASPNLKAEIMAVMNEERRKLKRMIDEEDDRERRKEF